MSQRQSFSKILRQTLPRRTGPPSREAASNNNDSNNVTAGRVSGAEGGG